MEPNFSTAFSLLLTGMITVFVVLSLVVLTGNLLIRIVNAFFPKPENIKQLETIDKRKIAAINAAVEMVTNGEGSVTKIEIKP